MEDWQEVLWEHHALYQDAVNYYLFALLGLASLDDNPLIKHKNGLDNDALEDGDTPSSEQIWNDFRRVGEKRRGLKDSIQMAFSIQEKDRKKDTVQYFWKIMYPKEVSKKVLDAALRELLDEIQSGEGVIQKLGRDMLPRFCWKGYSGGFPRGPASVKKHEGTRRLSTDLHELSGNNEIECFARTAHLGWVAKLQEGPSWKKEEWRQRLQEAIRYFEDGISMLQGERYPNGWSIRLRKFCADTEKALGVLQSMRNSLDAKKESDFQEIPKNRGGPGVCVRTNALLLFKYFPSDFTLRLLQSVFPKKDLTNEVQLSMPSEFDDDPIKLARGKRGYIFPAFTALLELKKEERDKEREKLQQHSDSDQFGQLIWKEFDVAAFKEALKSLHQIELKKEERDKEREKLQHRLACMKGDEVWGNDENESEDPRPPVFSGDPRVERLEILLTEDLAQEYNSTDGDMRSYGLTERTFRNFSKLKEKWDGVLQNASEYTPALKSELLEKLREFQVNNAYSMGSAKLYKALAEKENWIIWRKPSPDVYEEWRKKAEIPEGLEFGDDPLKVYAHKAYLERQIDRLEKPVRLTPADPDMSPRQYCFSDIKDSFKKDKNKEFGHMDDESLVINVFMNMDQVSWQQTRIRIFYSAPRLRRDGFRGADGSVIGGIPFLQPMMEGLGHAGMRQKEFREHAVSLMPRPDAKAKKFLLNFAPDVASDELVEHLGKQKRWKGQFVGPRDKNLYLVWPTLADDRRRPNAGWWWERGDAFSCLSVDLGQRTAGAYAVIEAMPEKQLKTDKPSRLIGGVYDKERHQERWCAVIRAHGMLRLPGEDRKEEYAGDHCRIEKSGKKGRNSSCEDMREAREICESLGFPGEEEFPPANRAQSFPSANDHLLRVFGKARWRFRRLQNLSWRLSSEETQKDAVQDICNSEEVCMLLGLSNSVDKLNHSMALNMVLSKLEQLREVLPNVIERIASRIMPSNTQCWRWKPHPSGTGSFILCRVNISGSRKKCKIMGQRGLSFARVEQLERLRVQVQGLNRSVMQEPGKEPKSGSQTRGDEYPDPCPEILARLDRIKEQRVNQTANLILAEALGVRLRMHKKSSHERITRDIHGEYEKYRDAVDFIVLEDLSRYLSSQGRSPRENSRLMKWSHRAILGKLKELAELYGIPVVEASAAYSSRFCSRTGVVGFRAEEISAVQKMEGFWVKALDRLEQSESNHGTKSRDAIRIDRVRKLFEVLEQNDSCGIGNSKRRTLLAPRDGGSIFVSMRGDVQQADINAAINLGLRAISSPDCHTIDPKVRVVVEQGELRVQKESKREKARWKEVSQQSALHVNGFADNLNEITEGRRYLNFFAVADGNDIRVRCASVDGIETKFASARDLFYAVKCTQWAVAKRINNARLEKWGCDKCLDENDGTEEDIPI